MTVLLMMYIFEGNGVFGGGTGRNRGERRMQSGTRTGWNLVTVNIAGVRNALCGLAPC